MSTNTTPNLLPATERILGAYKLYKSRTRQASTLLCARRKTLQKPGSSRDYYPVQDYLFITFNLCVRHDVTHTDGYYIPGVINILKFKFWVFRISCD